MPRQSSDLVDREANSRAAAHASSAGSRQADSIGTLADRIGNSPRMVAQRKLIHSGFGSAARAQGSAVLQRVGSETGTAVVQREKASIAIFGQSHNDENFLEKVRKEIEALIKSRVRFVVCMEEAPGVSWKSLIAEAEEALQSEELPREIAAQIRGDLPIYRLLQEQGIPVFGVDAMLDDLPSSQGGRDMSEFESKVAQAEFARLQAMTKGILGAAGHLTKQGGGVVVGLNFGNSHIAGLLKNLKAGHDGFTAGTIAVGDYPPAKKLGAAKRSVQAQQSALQTGLQTKIPDAKTLAEHLEQLIEDFFDEGTRSSLGLTITCTQEYESDIRSVMQQAVKHAESSRTTGEKERTFSSSNIRLDVVDEDDFQQMVRRPGSEKDALLRSDERDPDPDADQCCCIVQ